MTEDLWIRSDDWSSMLAHLPGWFGRRKGALYVCGGLRCIESLLYADSSRAAVEVAERAADGAATEDDVRYASWAAECPTFGLDFDPPFVLAHLADPAYAQVVGRLMDMGVFAEADIQGSDRLGDDATVHRLVNAADIAYHALDIAYRLLGSRDGLAEGRLGRHLVSRLLEEPGWPGGWLVREVFGNPFRPATLDRGWRTEAVVSLARGMYEARDFGPMSVLADALEDADCADPDVLAHCRGSGPHVRGCWVVDLVLGKQ